MKAFSPQGTYLLEHKKYRVCVKHLRECRRTEYPEKFKGVKVYYYGVTSDGCCIFTAKPKREGLPAFTIHTAAKLHNMEL